TRPPGDPRARDEARAAAAELEASTDEDRVRAAARMLVWARDTPPSLAVAVADARAPSLSAAARWEWWGARAGATPPSQRVLTELVALLDVPAPLGSRGPALAAGARLSRALGGGEAARRIEAARRVAAATLREGAPVEHRASLGAIAWLDGVADDDARSALGAAQVGELEAIVRALSSRDRLRPLLEQVVDTMVLWTGVERGLLLLCAPDGALVPRAARNLARQDLAGEQLELSTGLARRAMSEREAICATDAFAQVGDLHASVHALGLRSVLAVPLVARGDVLGVVYLDDRVRRGAFGPGELAWVRLVASQAALAIADARDQTLLRRAVRKAERANARLAAELGAREAELASVRAELASAGAETRFRYDEIAGRSEPMRAMLKLVDRVTASEVPVLLAGESGTGKELVARAIHGNGPRGARAFVSENCGSVPETLLESTLFGHVRGAFTGASATRAGLFDVADGGTLFLDEIGEMPLSMQTKLLRVLQNGEVRPVGGERSRTVDVRIIGATHRDLEAMVAAGTFREDLFYRLNVVSIRVPPLRERREDIPLLVSRFVEKYAAGRKVKVTRAAMDRLGTFPWPGNVRQLENEIRRALVLADDRIDAGELSEEIARGGPSAARDAGLGLKARVDALEAQLVRDALQKTSGNQTRAAEVLGVSRFGLQKMMRRLGIKVTA
ncbi:MAG: sigma 54-interacting transcriptional regulator, partial [Labilithrix sp.]|nr:sigma 54-interacting transcriptional regulator [Labilithrix sp.]